MSKFKFTQEDLDRMMDEAEQKEVTERPKPQLLETLRAKAQLGKQPPRSKV